MTIKQKDKERKILDGINREILFVTEGWLWILGYQIIWENKFITRLSSEICALLSHKMTGIMLGLVNKL